jgi:dipeptidase E
LNFSVQEFHEENDTPVLGLREGAILHREGDKLTIIGTTAGAVLFEKKQVPKQFQTNADLSFLVKQ